MPEAPSPDITLASFLGKLWLSSGNALRGLRQRPGLWQGLFLLLLAFNLAAFVLWMQLGPWAPYVQQHPLVLNGSDLAKAVPAALDLQRQQLWWNGLVGLLIGLPFWALLQGWIVWKVSQWLQTDPVRTYDHGMAALLASRIALIPFGLLSACLVWKAGGLIGPPGSRISVGFGLRIEMDSLPGRAGLSHDPLWSMALLALPALVYSWLAVRNTLGLSGWRALFLAVLAL